MKKKKVVKKEYDYRRTFLVFTIVFSIIIGISTYWIYAYKHKHPYLEDNIINYKIDSYVKTKGNVVYLENIDNKVTNDFVNKQHKIINNNKKCIQYTSNKETKNDNRNSRWCGLWKVYSPHIFKRKIQCLYNRS
mgnify:CR=1 FL=1